jgi:hypothetical protein
MAKQLQAFVFLTCFVELLLDLEGCFVDKCGKGRGILHGAQHGHEAKEMCLWPPILVNLLVKWQSRHSFEF